MKTCRECAVEKPLADFYKHSQTKDRLHPSCKECVKARARRNRRENRDEYRERDRARYTGARREAQIKRAHAQYHGDPEAGKAYRREWYRANPAAVDRARARRRANKRAAEHTPWTRPEIFQRDGGCCRACGTDLICEPHGYEIDHIVPLSLGGPDTPANLQLMCRPCNRRKHAKLEGQLHMPV